MGNDKSGQPADPDLSRDPAPWLLIFVVSAVAIGWEILLIRLFTIIQWHHLAFLVVSLALLGHGVSGVLITRWQAALLKRFHLLVILFTSGFATSVIVCTAAAGTVPFNNLEILWDPGQWLLLGWISLLLLIPYLFASLVIAATLRYHKKVVGPLYACDLTGAGTGAITVSLALFTADPGQLVLLLTMFIVMAMVYTCWQWRLLACIRAIRAGTGLTLIISVLLVIWFHPLPLAPAEYKPLSMYRLLPGVSVEYEKHSPFGLIQVIDSPQVPLRLSPGLSLFSRSPLPEQKGLFLDGHGPFPVNRLEPGKTRHDYLDETPSALPYHLLESEQPRVLLFGLKGNSQVLQARHFEVSQVDLVEENRAILELFSTHLADYAGWNAMAPDIQVHLATRRGFLRQSGALFDLILLPSQDAGHSLESAWHLTEEALNLYWRHLKNDGMLAVEFELQRPPRSSLRAVNTLKSIADKNGPLPLEAHLLAIRSWNRILLVVSRSAFTEKQVSTARSFTETRGFDSVYFPGITREDVNRFNRLPQPVYYQAITRLLSDEAEPFTHQYPFDISAARDNRPFYFHFFRWQSLPDLVVSKDSGSLGLIGRDYPVLILCLLLATVFSIGLIILPLKSVRMAMSGKLLLFRTGLYFGALGLAFLMVEMVLIEWYMLALGYPSLSAAVVLGTMLVFSGLGSLSTHYLGRYFKTVLSPVLWLIVMTGLMYLLGINWIFAAIDDWSLTARVLCCIATIAPLAWLMGMPFPLGLNRLAATDADWMPWAWGINGCCSVISAVLSTLLAVHLGFQAVLAIALGLYGLAALSCSCTPGVNDRSSV